MEKSFCYRSWFVRSGTYFTLDHLDESKANAVSHALRVARDEGVAHIETKRISRPIYRRDSGFTKVEFS